MIILQILIGLFFAVGIGYILADLLKVPSMKATKAASNLGHKGDKKTSIVSSVNDISNINVDNYLFRHFDNPLHDNIACERQTIEIETIMAKKICLLGFCEYGAVHDLLELNCEDEPIKKEFVLKTFHTFDFQALNYTEQNAKCKLALKLPASDGQKRNIYYYVIELDSIKRINTIILPNNPALHILAITLE